MDTAPSAWSTVPDFEYPPLPDPSSSLRLIGLDFSRVWRDDEPLSLSLDTYTRDTTPRYYALSYAWGTLPADVPILLSGRRFMVTPHLEAALRSLREWTKALNSATTYWPVWIDAICIDQGNVNERNEQVQRMKSIYAEVEMVMIWLGGPIESSDELAADEFVKRGFADANQGSSPLDLEVNSFVNALHSNVIRRPGQILETPPLKSVATLVTLSKIFHRPWFERLWVIQELHVATSAAFFFGTSNLGFSSVKVVADWVLRPPEYISADISRLLPWVGAHRFAQVILPTNGGQPANTLVVLQQTQEARCSDPRDKLYAIMGVVSDPQDVQIDYSVPVADVYRRWAARRIQRTQSLDVLSACADSGRSGDLPSWVPDLRKPYALDKPLWMRVHGRPLAASSPPLPVIGGHNVSKFHEFQYFDDLDTWRLFAIGYLNDIVSSVGTIADCTKNLLDPTELTATLLDIVNRWEDMVRTQLVDSGSSYDKGLFDHPYVNTKFADTLLRGYRSWGDEDPIRSLEDRYFQWRALGQSREIDYRDPELRSLDRNFQKRFDRILFPMINGCQMFMTKRGLIGMVAGNCHIQVGDEVYQLIGSKTPTILRQRERLGEYRVMGPCYVSGLGNAAERFSAMGEKLPRSIVLV